MSSDKEIFILSIITGWLGAISYVLTRAINEAQHEQKRFNEDARARFEHQQNNQSDGGDI